MTSLTQRYVAAVLRGLPTQRRADLEPEIRALVADAVEARSAAGTEADAAAVERAALVELGDPDALAARYADRPMMLIGPRYFSDWKRLLGLLLPIVVPIAMLGVTAAAAIGGQAPHELVGVALSTGFGVAVQLVFWITLVFAVLERTDAAPLGTAWTPEQLPEVSVIGGESRAELAVAAVAIVIGSGLLIWQQLARPIVIDGVGLPVFDGALWPFWMCWFLGLLAVELVALIWRWRRGGWTWPLAVLNLLTNVAFAVPALWLLGNGNLFDPGLEAAVAAQGFASALAPAGTALMVIVAASAAWDAFDGFRMAWRRHEAGAAAIPS